MLFLNAININTNSSCSKCPGYDQYFSYGYYTFISSLWDLKELICRFCISASTASPTQTVNSWRRSRAETLPYCQRSGSALKCFMKDFVKCAFTKLPILINSGAQVCAISRRDNFLYVTIVVNCFDSIDVRFVPVELEEDIQEVIL